jgi:hypothetical protein
MKQLPKPQKPTAGKKFLPEPISTQEEALALEEIIEQNQQFDRDIPAIPARIEDVDNRDLP